MTDGPDGGGGTARRRFRPAARWAGYVALAAVGVAALLMCGWLVWGFVRLMADLDGPVAWHD